MPARFALAPATILAAALALAAQPPDPAKKPPDAPKTTPAESPGVKLADGTYLWTGDAVPPSVAVSPQELQKLLDQVEQMKKQLAARKVLPPSSCAVRGKVEKRGDTVVAALKLTFTFRTPAPSTAVSLGGRRGFLVSATLDGGKLPVLDTREDGFVALVEAAGEHALVLDLEAPVAGRGTKTEIGFELGLPRAAITTLGLELPPDIKQVSLTTRMPDPSQPTKAPDVRRLPALDVKRLTSLPLGPIDQLELAWDPPATAAQPSESVRAAEFDIATVLTESLVETTARVKFKGAAREWKLVAPASAEVTVERVTAAGVEAGPVQSPGVTKPPDANKPVWKIDLPVGSSAADWVVTAVVRTPRAKADSPKHRGPFAVGPFAAVDVFRQSGTVRLSAAANHRFAARHGPEVRQAEVPGPPDDEQTVALYRFVTGPTGAAPPFAPLLSFEAFPLQGAVRVKPAYRLRLTEAGWRVTATLRVTPIRKEIAEVAVEVPAEWGTLEATPAELVTGVQQVQADGPRQTVSVKLAAGHKQPFELVLDATVPVPPAAREMAVSLLRFPGVDEQDAAITVAVPDALEVRGSAREWAGDQPLGWGQPLAVVPGADGKVPKHATAVTGKFERGLARADLSWGPYRPDLAADVRADVTVHDRQVVVVQQFKLKAADGLPRPVRFRAPPGAVGLRAQPPLEPAGNAEWTFTPPADAKDATVAVTFALPLPAADAARRVPVGLVWAAGATRTDTVVRAWSNTVTGRTIAAEAGPWREIPSEAAADRDALPAVTLAGSGADLPLAFDLRDGADPAVVGVWVERAAVQVSAADDGSAAVRARFLLKRWLAGAVEVRLPPNPTKATAPEFQIDGRKVDAAAVADDAQAYRVPLPEARPGRTAVLEVRYQLPANRPGGESLFTPPLLAATAFAGPVRWHVALPPGSLPLVTDAKAEQRWRWRAAWFRPAGATTGEELDRWFRAGGELNDVDGGDAVSARQATAGPLRVHRVDRVGFAVLCSFAAFAVGWSATRVRASAAGVLVAAAGLLVAVGAALAPQAAAQAAAAAQPGVLALLLILAFQEGVRWHYRRRVTYLPGFSRRPVEAEPSAAGGTSARNPRGNESTGSLGPPAEAAASPSGS